MTGSLVIKLVLILALIAMNGFFAAAEMALVSLNRIKLRSRARKGDRRAKRLMRFLNEPSRFLATIQVGITLAGFFASASAATNIAAPFTLAVHSLGIPMSVNVAIVIITLVLSYIILVLGELLPKRIALQFPETIALYTALPITIFSQVFLPFIKLLTLSTRFLFNLLKLGSKTGKEHMTEEDIRLMLHHYQEKGVIDKQEIDMIEGVFLFDDIPVRNIMVHRRYVAALDINTPLERAVGFIQAKQFSRLPVFRDHLDNVVGVVHIKDFYFNLEAMRKQELSMADIIRPAYFIPEHKKIDRLFSELRKARSHMALVVDEYGALQGLITMEDVIEAVMGSIMDEHDHAHPAVQQVSEKTYRINGLARIREINRILGTDLPCDEYETISGLLVGAVGHFSENMQGRDITLHGVTFTIKSVKDNHVHNLIVRMP